MKKLTLAMRIGMIVLALAVGAVASHGIAAKKEVEYIAETMAHADKMDVGLYIFGDAESITVSDPAELDEIRAVLSDIQYKGLCKSRNMIQPSDRVCSVLVSTPETSATITLYPSGHAQSSYIAGEPLDTALKNTDALYETVRSFFE